MIHCGQALGIECGTHPPCAASTKRVECPVKPVKLRTRLNANAQQLRFVHHPQAVVVEQAKMHGPAVAAHAVPTVESAAEKHVLSASEDGCFFRIGVPFALWVIKFFTAHQNYRRVRRMLASAVAYEPAQFFKTLVIKSELVALFPQILKESGSAVTCLLDKSPHRQAINQPP